MPKPNNTLANGTLFEAVMLPTDGQMKINPLNCFLTSCYDSVENMDMAAFLRYFPGAEMGGEVFRRGFAHEADAEGEEYAVEGNLRGALDRADDVVGRLLAKSR